MFHIKIWHKLFADEQLPVLDTEVACEHDLVWLRWRMMCRGNLLPGVCCKLHCQPASFACLSALQTGKELIRGVNEGIVIVAGCEWPQKVWVHLPLKHPVDPHAEFSKQPGSALRNYWQGDIHTSVEKHLLWAHRSLHTKLERCFLKDFLFT